mgnify:FL=1
MMRGNFYAVKYNKLSFDDYILEYLFCRILYEYTFDVSCMCQ